MSDDGRHRDARTLAEGVRYLDLGLREAQVVRLYLPGKTVPEIAKRLRLSPSTVRTYLNRVYRRHSVHSRGELAEIVYKAIRRNRRR